MSRTFRKKHDYTNSELKTQINRLRTIDWTHHTIWRFSLGYDTISDLEFKANKWADKMLLSYTTDNGSKGWKPWTKSLKQANARKSRAHKRRELSKVYRDWEYDVELIKYNHHDDRWNWD